MMFKEGPANTALLTAAARALEDERPDRLFADPYSKLLAGKEGLKLLEEFNEAFTLVEAIRTRFFDDAIAQAIKDGIKQFVVLGAGLDTRPYRLEFPGGALWVEVDFASVLEYKRRVLKDIKANVKIADVGSDLTELDVERDLVPKGFKPEEQSAWIAEGLIAYLDDQQVENLISLISNASSRGSRLVATCPNKAIMKKDESTRQRNDFMKRINASWVFSGTDNPEELFGKYGYKINAVFLGHREAHYGILPWPAVEDLPKDHAKEWFIRGVKI